MKRLGIVLLALVAGGCARPGEFGWSPVETLHERDQMIARNWDWEGKQVVDDVDHALMLRPMGHLTLWNLR